MNVGRQNVDLGQVPIYAREDTTSPEKLSTWVYVYDCLKPYNDPEIHGYFTWNNLIDLDL
jgi:hypothetical protein